MKKQESIYQTYFSFLEHLEKKAVKKKGKKEYLFN